MTGKTAMWILKARREKARKLAALTEDPVKARRQTKALGRTGPTDRKKKKHGRQT